jgi:hypothetical protein
MFHTFNQTPLPLSFTSNFLTKRLNFSLSPIVLSYPFLPTTYSLSLCHPLGFFCVVDNFSFTRLGSLSLCNEFRDLRQGCLCLSFGHFGFELFHCVWNRSSAFGTKWMYFSRTVAFFAVVSDNLLSGFCLGNSASFFTSIQPHKHFVKQDVCTVCRAKYSVNFMVF